jgi:hypothetical protein
VKAAELCRRWSAELVHGASPETWSCMLLVAVCHACNNFDVQRITQNTLVWVMQMQ